MSNKVGSCFFLFFFKTGKNAAKDTLSDDNFKWRPNIKLASHKTITKSRKMQ